MNDNQTSDNAMDSNQAAEEHIVDSPLQAQPAASNPQKGREAQEPDREVEKDKSVERKANAESAKYRRRLRETEAERDSLAQAAETASQTIYQQAVQALQSKGEALRHPQDLSLFTGKQPSDYIKDGQLDQEALQADADKLHQERPELFRAIRYSPRPDKSQGYGGGELSSKDAWRNAFKPA